MNIFVWTITVFLAVGVVINLWAVAQAVNPFVLARDLAPHVVWLAILIPLFMWGCVVLATAP